MVKGPQINEFNKNWHLNPIKSTVEKLNSCDLKKLREIFANNAQNAFC